MVLVVVCRGRELKFFYKHTYIMYVCTYIQYVPIHNVLAEAVSKKYIILTMTVFVRSQISLPSFMFVSATVSEIRE